MFEKRLKQLVTKFDKEKAFSLSLEIHTAEENGYDLTPKEERLWSKLTEKIQQ